MLKRIMESTAVHLAGWLVCPAVIGPLLDWPSDGGDETSELVRLDDIATCISWDTNPKPRPRAVTRVPVKCGPVVINGRALIALNFTQVVNLVVGLSWHDGSCQRSTSNA